MANIVENNKKSTLNRPIGLSLDGVELYSPSVLEETIYYGQIENVKILNEGSEYNVITPPEIQVIGAYGTGQGAKIHGNMKGTLTEVLIVSPGLGYKTKPILSLRGGNINGSIKLDTNLVKKIIKSEFISTSGVGNSTITFLNNHNFDSGEEVIYITNNTPVVSGLTTSSSYIADALSLNTISLYRNYQDFVNKTNVIDNLSSTVGINTGLQYFWSKNYKNTIDKVYIDNKNAVLYNTSVIINSNSHPNTQNKNGINTSLNYIYAQNHNLNEKDLVVYHTSGTNISGLSTTKQYYVKIIDSDKFKLSDAGSSSSPNDTNYKNEVFVSFSDVGVGTHIFRYPPITIEASIIAESTVASAPILKPIVIGEFNNIFIEDKGVGYGLSEVVNNRALPQIRIKGQNYFDNAFNSEASLTPIIEDGKIIKVIVLNSGDDYQDGVEITVGGSGKYAKLLANVNDGKIVSVDILEPGVGYLQQDTKLFTQRRGKNAKFLVDITKWTLDQYFTHKNEINSNPGNGFIIPSRYVKNSSQFINFFPSNLLRSNFNDNKETIKNSPVLGWAYDGNPIFGPYVVKNNSVIPLKSGYEIKNNLLSLNNDNKRPPFAPGTFIEDYEYIEGISQLDEHNGMFINDRKEFPNGTYAYFMTVDITDSPSFPYVIGKSFHNTPNKINDNFTFNQNLDITNKNFVKNTSSLYLNEQYSGYEYLKPIQTKYKQELIVKNILGSKIDGFRIIDPGQNYKVGEQLVFTTDDVNEPTPNAEISRLNGEKIVNINIGITTLTNIKFKNENNKIIGYSTLPHNFKDNQVVYISNTSNNNLNGNKKINVISKVSFLQSSLGSSGSTAYISINNVNEFSVGDFIKIDNELDKVLEIHPNSSKLFIQRIQNIQSHTSGVSTVTILPTKFEFKETRVTDKLSVDNLKYFNSKVAVGLGTTGINIVNTNLNTTYFIPEKQIYIPNHGFNINQPITYNVGTGYSGILVSNTESSPTYRLINGQTVYPIIISKDFIGITTVAYGITALTFRESNYTNDEIHSFTHIGTSITGKAESYSLEIVTDKEHNLLTNDIIRLNGAENTWEYYVIQIDLNHDYPVTINNSNSFTINLRDRPEFIKYFNDNSLDIIQFDSNNVNYNTTSLNAHGGINDINLYFTGNSYKNIPIIDKIETLNGESAIVIPYSDTIGKIDTVERIKDGFDYPSDITLQPNLSANTVCYLNEINKISEILVTFGGRRYNTPPTLKVIENDSISLSASLNQSTVDKVNVDVNYYSLSTPLEIIPVNNSNGFDILSLAPINASTNRIQIDLNQFPLIYRDYAEPFIDFPFKIGDSIFIENCRITETDKNTYNSADNSYSYFNVVGVNTSLGYIDYQIDNVNLSNSEFGTYSISNGYGIVVNKNDMATFEMKLVKGNYIEGETVKVINSTGDTKFVGQVKSMNGWDPRNNQLRISNSTGTLHSGDVVIGSISLLSGKVLYVNEYSINSNFGSSRDKINYKDNVSDLNSQLKKIQDSYYYQDFSYSIKSKIPYDIWSEPVRSIIHPSGFKEFSDLQIISEASNKLKLKTTDSILNFDLKIENENSFFTRNNFTIFYEDDRINANTTERVYSGSGENRWQVAGVGSVFVRGIELLPYITNITNIVKKIKNISPEFNGTNQFISLGTTSFTFNSNSVNFLGVNTTGLQIGDFIGYSTNHEYPYDTRIVSIGINSVGTLHPHKVNTGIITESLELIRRLNYSSIVGVTSFRLVDENNTPFFSITGTSSNILIPSSVVNIRNNFQNGQKIYYSNVGGEPIGILTTTNVTGGISTDILPNILYVTKIDDEKFKVSGLSTSAPLSFTTSGTGTHKFVLDSPDTCALITIDNIIQTPIHSRNLNLELSSSVGIGSTVLYVSSGINSITTLDILKVNNEYLKVKTIGVTSTNTIEVERSFLGTIESNHTGINTISVYRGNYRINENTIYFTSPPYGPTGLSDLKISSSFDGRVFIRSFSPLRPNDKNLILDDISDNFIGISSFALSENGNNVVGLYTNTNSDTSININNNPLIFINNIAQKSNVDFEIIEPNNNKIKFINETPETGKILSFELKGGSGYLPLVAAAATVSVSTAGTISNVYLNGAGSGYRSAPVVKIVSNSGYGASISANVGIAGTITGLTIVNSGIGYTTSDVPQILIDSPIPYYNMSLEYDNTNTGIGTEAKIKLKVNDDSTITQVDILNSGKNYKVGDELIVVGLKTDTIYGTNFSKLILKVKEVISDQFTGIYPGQFIQFDDISSQFNSSKTAFNITVNINGQSSIISFENRLKNLAIENYFFIFINDILQIPNESYQYNGGRIIFKEPPKEGSSCNILYFQGSIDDVELIVPNQTIKNGDTIKFESNNSSNVKAEQADRVVRRLIASNILDTFSYSGYGITSSVRPITWTKQKNDRIIQGSLISKGRDSQRSKIYPNSKLIWNIQPNDTSFYVDNAYPLFIELDDEVGGITEEQRNVNIINPTTLEYPEFIVTVSSASTIRSIDIVASGIGYTSNPTISISQPIIKDPFYSLNSVSGVSTDINFNSLTIGNVIVAVGQSNTIGTSINLTNWNISTASLPITTDFKKITNVNNQVYISVGSSGVIAKSPTGYSDWTLCGIKTETSIGFVDSTYNLAFNDVIYNEHLDSWVVVGEGGKIYRGTGINTTVFYEVSSYNFDYYSISYNENIMIAVGNQGVSTSTNSLNWFTNANIPSANFSSIIKDGSRFIVASTDGIYIVTNNGSSWDKLNNSPTDIKKIIKYEDIFVGISLTGKLIRSINLIDWIIVEPLMSGVFNDIIPFNYETIPHQVMVGAAGTILYSNIDYNKASLSVNTLNSSISSITVNNGGFGYSLNKPPSVLIESPKNHCEQIYAIKAKGDYGKIVGIKTSNTGVGTNSPSISFELLTDYSISGYDSLNTFGITYSQLNIGDYFIITNSNVNTNTGYALTGITTSLGGMSNYPLSKVGTAKSYLDGVYKAEYVQYPSIPQGITTVTCNVVPVNGGIGINTIGITTNYYGNYSWSQIFDYEERSSRTPLQFIVNTDNGLVGLETSPVINRMPPLTF